MGSHLLVSGVSLALVAAACASPPPPRAEIARAEAAIEQAESANAEERAPAEMRMAREKLDGARQEMDDEHPVEARRLAEQAEVDAQLASASADRAQTEEATQEVQKTLRALDEESHR